MSLQPTFDGFNSRVARALGHDLDDDRGALDKAIAWMRQHGAGYGASLGLHAAAVALAAVSIWVVHAPPMGGTGGTGGFTIVRQTKVQVAMVGNPAQKLRAPPRSGGRIPTVSALDHEATTARRAFIDDPFPPVVGNELTQLDVVGAGGGGNHIGGWEGLGNGGRGGAGFFGCACCGVQASKIVYIIDRSGSMADTMDFVKYELKRSISELADDQQFQVMFFTSGPPIEMPGRGLASATERSKQIAFEFIDTVVAGGETDPAKALERAFACKPEAIYLLTDGEFDRQVADLVKRLNVGGKVAVHTIAFLYSGDDAILRQIAADSGGHYTFVSEGYLAGGPNTR